MEKIIIPREIGDHWFSGVTWLEYGWEGKYYRVPPIEGYEFTDEEWQMKVELRSPHYMTPEIYFSGGYVVVVKRVEQ